MSWPEWTSPDGRIRLIQADCLDVLPTLEAGSVDAVVTDPPYGIRYDASRSTQKGIQKFGMIHDDNKPFDPAPWLNFDDVILWGVNNYCDKIPPRHGQWYFWDKVTRNALKVRIAEGEYAWHKKGTKPRAFRHLWSGAYRASESGKKSVHPTQKPVALMEWCLSLVQGETILDPFAGSFTTAVACIRTNRRCIAIEKEPKYFDIGVQRCEAEYAKNALLDREAVA